MQKQMMEVSCNFLDFLDLNQSSKNDVTKRETKYQILKQ